MRYWAIFALWAMAIVGLVRCGDEETTPQVTVAECEQWFDRLAACEPGGGPLYWAAQESKEFCGVQVALTNCQLKEMSTQCRDVYTSYTSCSTSLKTCEELKSYYYGMSSTETTDYPCSEEVSAFTADCANEMFGSSVLSACEDEFNAFSDAVNSMNPDTDTDTGTDVETGDTELDTDVSTDDTGTDM